MRFTTASGSTYEIKTIADGRQYIVRLPDPGNAKRADRASIRLYRHSPIEVGSRVWMEMESLAGYGPDDYGTTEPSHITTRVTSPVTSIEGDDE